MANYDASLTTDLGVGEVQTLSNAALVSTFDTQAIAVGRDAAQPCELVVYNHSAVVATVFAAEVDLDASYAAYKVDGTAVTIAGTTTQQFRCAARFVRLRMASDPGATVVAIGR